MGEQKRLANKVARGALSKAMNYVIYQFPLEGHVLTQLPVFIIPSSGNSGETAFCCRQGLFFFDEFILSLVADKSKNNVGQRRLWFLVLHELRHFIYMHVNRWIHFSNMLNDSKNRNSAQLFNIAADLVINGDLVNDYGEMQEPLRPEFIPAGIFDKEGKYRGMSAEEIYFKLLQEQDATQTQKNSSIGERPSELAIYDLREATEAELAIAQAVSDVGQPIKELSESDMMEVIHTAIQLAKIKGTPPSSAERILKELTQTKTAWNVQLRKYMRAFEKEGLTYHRPNKRFLSQSMIMPSTTKKKRLKNVVLAIDTSGSISDKQLTYFASEVTKIASECRVETLTVIFADANVANVQTFKHPAKNIAKKLIPAGGGGTNFRPAFEYVKTHNLNPEIFIYFTDLYGSFPDRRDAPKATIWAVPEKSKFIEVPFGHKLVVDTRFLKP